MTQGLRAVAGLCAALGLLVLSSGTSGARAQAPALASVERVPVTPAIRSQLRAAYLRTHRRSLRDPQFVRSFPPRVRSQIRHGRIGPLSAFPVRTARSGDLEWAVATFWALGDQPEVFRRKVGVRRWQDLGDTGGGSCPTNPPSTPKIPHGVLKGMGLLEYMTKVCGVRDDEPEPGLIHFGPASVNLGVGDAGPIEVRAWIYSPPTTSVCLVSVGVYITDASDAPLGEVHTTIDACAATAREPWPGWRGRQVALVAPLAPLDSTGAPTTALTATVRLVAGVPGKDEREEVVSASF